MEDAALAIVGLAIGAAGVLLELLLGAAIVDGVGRLF
jgi:hypothetical protein